MTKLEKILFREKTIMQLSSPRDWKHIIPRQLLFLTSTRKRECYAASTPCRIWRRCGKSWSAHWPDYLKYNEIKESKVFISLCSWQTKCDCLTLVLTEPRSQRDQSCFGNNCPVSLFLHSSYQIKLLHYNCPSFSYSPCTPSRHW